MKILLLLIIPIIIFFTILPNTYAENVPDWVKNTAGWWASDAISETEFVNAMEFLVKENIIDVSETNIGKSSTSGVPDWVKNTAGWWASDAISETEFVNAIEFLVKDGIIKIKTSELELETILQLFKEKVISIDEGKPQSEKIAAIPSSYNSFGFRGEEFSAKKPDNTFRIFAIGGSTTFGVGVENEFTWPAYLQSQLDSITTNQEIEIINAGIPAASIYQNSKLITEKIVNLEPDMLIIYEVGNDAECMIPNYTNSFTEWKIPIGKCGNHPINEHPKFLANIFDDICTLGKQNEIEIIITLQPILNFNNRILTNQEIESYFIQPRNAFMLDNHLKIINQVLEKTTECENVHDFTSIFDKHDTPLYFDRIHVGKLGNKIISENVAESIMPILKKENVVSDSINEEKTSPRTILIKKAIQNSDFSNQKINDETFFGMDLRNSDFSNSELSNVDFQLTDLRGVNFENTRFNDVVFRQNNFKGADFTGVDFENVNLTNMDLSYANLQDSNLSNKNFKTTFFHKTNLSGADLSSSDFSNILLYDVNLFNANLKHTIFTSANLEYIKNKNLGDNPLIGTVFSFANLKGVELPKQLNGINFASAVLDDQDLSNTKIVASLFYVTQMKGANLENADLSPELGVAEIDTKKNPHLLGLPLSEVLDGLGLFSTITMPYATTTEGDIIKIEYIRYNNFVHAELQNSNMKNADLRFANIGKANLSNVDLTNANLMHVLFDDANLSNANLSNANLEGANLEGANLEGANLEGANLEGAKLTCTGHDICN